MRGLAPSAGPFYGSTAMIRVPGPRMAWTPFRPMRDSYPNGGNGAHFRAALLRYWARRQGYVGIYLIMDNGPRHGAAETQALGRYTPPRASWLNQAEFAGGLPPRPLGEPAGSDRPHPEQRPGIQRILCSSLPMVLDISGFATLGREVTRDLIGRVSQVQSFNRGGPSDQGKSKGRLPSNRHRRAATPLSRFP